MAKDPNYDRYAGIVSLPGPDGKLPRPFRVDEDGNVIYRDEERGIGQPMSAGKSRDLARAGVLDWDELDAKAAQLSATGARRFEQESAQGQSAPVRQTIDGVDYDVLSSINFDPALSNGVTALPNLGLMSAAILDKDKVAVPYGPEEKGGYLRREPAFSDYDVRPHVAGGLGLELRDDPKWATVDDLAVGNDGIYVSKPGPGFYTTVPALHAKTKDTGDANTLDFDYPRSFPQNTEALTHGHIDDGPKGWDGRPIRSDGMVDAPMENKGFGDAVALQIPMPMATVSEGKVGWHVMENGQLRFMYPAGALTTDQIKSIQANLNREQKKFHRR